LWFARIQILAYHGLTLSSFSTAQEAYDAADVLIAKQRSQELFQNVADAFPDQIVGVKQLDQFYYFSHEGTLVAPEQNNIYIYMFFVLCAM